MVSFFKKLVWTIVSILLILNVLILISGKTYLYKGIANTYLKGRTGPSTTEYNIFENREVAKGIPQPWLLSKKYNQKNLNKTQLNEFEKYQTTSFLIIKNDSIIHEQYWENFDCKTRSNSFSMAKTIVSILVGAAIKEGKIKNVDEPASNYIPEFKLDPKKSKITIKHILTMSSGIDFDENYASPFSYPAQAYYGDELRSLTLKYPALREPGKTFEYLSGNTQLLAMILEEATGKKISDYASEKLWKPLGAEQNALWNLDKENGDEKAFCCFISSARDFARLGKLYLNKGFWNGNQLIDTNFIENSITLANLTDKKGHKNNKYGYAWWILPKYKGLRIFYARGILGQYIICIPEKNMIVVRLGRKRAPKTGDEHPKDFFIYLDAALEIYGTD
jgi:CubicO group peptidase (beta-lactamase class C family)